MRSHARVVVIGGGVVGCSVLYHLARAGWTDAMLLERSELTSGSTWHAAGGCHTINGDPNVAKLQKYTIELYREIEELSGQATGFHMTGGVMLASTPERFDWLKSMSAKGRYQDIETEVITPEQAHEIMPLLDPAQFVGGLRTVVDGHLDPSGVTWAYAKSARKLGAEYHQHTLVTGIERQASGEWLVRTDKGDVTAEHIVNAGGLWAREVGRMVGLELPVLAMEHMYLLTEDMPEVAEINAATGKEVVHAVDFDGELYLRQERGGMLMGTYEKACVPWSERTTPWEFGHELLPPDIDRIAPSLEVGFRHFPAFERAGIKQIINGPFTFAPDGNPLVGPVRGRPGFWSACGVMAGFSQGGGVGLALANWMVDGDPGFDVWAMDIARYGDWATMAYTNKKVQENYSRRFSIRFPNEELTAGRPLKTVPIHDRLLALGAQMGDSWGLEAPLWFAPEGVRDVFSWRRSADFEHVAAEVAAVREGVGVIDISGFSKFRVTGPGARGWLDRMLACRMPAPGRMVLAPMLKERRQADRRPDARLPGRERLFPRRLRAGRDLLHALVGATPAGGRLGTDRGRRAAGVRTFDRRAECAQGAGEADADGCLGGRLALHGRARDGGGDGPLPGRPGQLHRRSGVRDLDEARIPAARLRAHHAGGRGPRHPAVRAARAERHAAREELWRLGARVPAALRPAGSRARPLRRL